MAGFNGRLAKSFTETMARMANMNEYSAAEFQVAEVLIRCRQRSPDVNISAELNSDIISLEELDPATIFGPCLNIDLS
jgi:hypothetical protein